jgi:hypothetical protein
MPVSALINSFNAGELSPYMGARSDVEKYRNGCSTLENFIILPYGGVIRRPGTEYLGNPKFNNRRCRLIGFNFSTTTRFVIEMGHQYLRFWSNGVQVLSGGNPVEVPSPYLESQLREVQFVQINDIMYLVHPDVAPHKLSRLADTNWTLTEVAWDWPALLDENLTDTTLACSHLTGNNRTLTASTGIFNAGHVGSYWQLGHALEAVFTERNIDGNANSTNLNVFGDWEFSTSGVWSAIINIEQSEDNGSTWQVIRSYKGSAERNITASGKTEREVLLRLAISNYVTGSAWATNTNYALDTVVTYENNVYKCVLGHNSNAPAWSEFAGNYALDALVTWNTRTYKCTKAHNNTTSNWSGSSTNYAVGTLVKHNERTYKCVKAHNNTTSSYTNNQSVTAGTQFDVPNEDAGIVFYCHTQYAAVRSPWSGTWPSADKFANQIVQENSGTSAFWRVVSTVIGSTTTYATARQDNLIQMLTSNTQQEADYEMGRLEKRDYTPNNPEYWELQNFRPSNFEYWEPVDFTPANQKYWTPINFGTRIARLEAADSRVYGIVKVTGFTSATQVTVNVVNPVAKTTATKIWSEGAWSTHQGFPRTVTLHQGRIYYGGTERRPLSIWGSVVDDFQNLRLTTNNDGGLFLTLSAKEANRLMWMESQDKLLIGTSGNEWTLGASTDEGITPSNVTAQKQSSYGSKYLPAATINDVLLFVQRQGRKVRELVYVLDKDGWVAPDLTVLAEHVTSGEIVERSYQQQTDAIYWAVKGDGQLIGMTYERDQNVVGWHRHTTDGAFESVATIYGLGGTDEVWLSVQRTVGGQTKRFIERFYTQSRETFEAADKLNWWYLDCAVRYSGTANATMSGLSHLNGRTVDVLANGSVETPKTVAGGQITLDKARTTVLAGLPFTSTLQPMTIDINNMADGTSRGRFKRIHRMVLALQKSLGGEVSTDQGQTWQYLYNRDFPDPMDASPPVFTGDTEVVTASDHDRNLQVMVRQNQPLPLTVLALVAKIDFYGD